MARSHLRALLTAAAVLSPSLAMAHPGQGGAFSFAHGLAHPLGGADHVLAMIMVGLLAVRVGGRAIWLVPTSFVTVLALGSTLGFHGVGLPFLELGIALSVIGLGVVLAFGLTPSVAVTGALVVFCAVFHGYAHGAEMPDTVGGIAYAAGFVAASGLLHAVGLAIGLALVRTAKVNGAMLVKCLGGGASLAGMGILAGSL